MPATLTSSSASLCSVTLWMFRFVTFHIPHSPALTAEARRRYPPLVPFLSGILGAFRLWSPQKLGNLHDSRLGRYFVPLACLAPFGFTRWIDVPRLTCE